MSHIRSTNSKPEEIVRKYLFSQGFRYRKNDKRYPGKPDIVLPKYRTIIFVHGCFWHMHEGCPDFVWPKSNLTYWKPKIERNHLRDSDNTAKLKQLGWHVIVVWECELKKPNRNETLANLANQIRKSHSPAQQRQAMRRYIPGACLLVAVRPQTPVNPGAGAPMSLS